MWPAPAACAESWLQAGLAATPGYSDSRLMMPAVTAARTGGMDSVPTGTPESRSHRLAACGETWPPTAPSLKFIFEGCLSLGLLL